MNTKRITALLSATLGALAISTSAYAELSAADIAKLGTTLTPMGAEKAGNGVGNAVGTIPAWDGGLSKVPAEKVAKILQDSSPMLERVLGRAEAPRAGAPGQNQPRPRVPAAKIARDDYFNTTVQQGDGGGLTLVPIIGLLAAMALLLTWLLGS